MPLNEDIDIKSLSREVEEQKAVIKFIADAFNSSDVKYKYAEDFLQEYDNLNENMSFGNTQVFANIWKIYEELCFYSSEKSLIYKNVIAVAGSFSSGKSSFINSFINGLDIILPRDIDPTTVIPTFIYESKIPEISAYTRNFGKINVAPEMMKFISHVSKVSSYFSWVKLFSHIVMKNNLVSDIGEICFLDTPGFNSGRSNSDDNTAISSLESADVLIWIFNARDGILQDYELSLIEKIQNERSELPLYFIMNKSDLKSNEELNDIITLTDNLLKNRNIKYEGISAYSSRYKYLNQKHISIFKKKNLPNFLFNFRHKNNSNTNKLLSLLKNTVTLMIESQDSLINYHDAYIRLLSETEYYTSLYLNETEGFYDDTSGEVKSFIETISDFSNNHIDYLNKAKKNKTKIKNSKKFMTDCIYKIIK